MHKLRKIESFAETAKIYRLVTGLDDRSIDYYEVRARRRGETAPYFYVAIQGLDGEVMGFWGMGSEIS